MTRPKSIMLRERLDAAKHKHAATERLMNEYYVGDNGVEVIDAVKAWDAHLDFARGCIIYYIVRAGKKPGETYGEAMAKALHYIELSERKPGKHMSPSELQTAFGLSDNQGAAIYACVYGPTREVKKALIKCLDEYYQLVSDPAPEQAPEPARPQTPKDPE